MHPVTWVADVETRRQARQAGAHAMVSELQIQVSYEVNCETPMLFCGAVCSCGPGNVGCGCGKGQLAADKGKGTKASAECTCEGQFNRCPRSQSCVTWCLPSKLLICTGQSASVVLVIPAMLPADVVKDKPAWIKATRDLLAPMSRAHAMVRHCEFGYV